MLFEHATFKHIACAVDSFAVHAIIHKHCNRQQLNNNRVLISMSTLPDRLSHVNEFLETIDSLLQQVTRLSLSAPLCPN